MCLPAKARGRQNHFASQHVIRSKLSNSALSFYNCVKILLFGPGLVWHQEI